MLGRESEVSGVSCRADLDKHAGPCFVFRFSELYYLAVSKARIAIQIVLAGPNDHIVGAAIFKARDLICAILLINNCLAQLKLIKVIR